MNHSYELKRLIESQFQTLKEQSLSQKQEESETINYPELVGELEDKNSLLQELVHYQLLQGNLRLSDIPQRLRGDLGYYNYSFRYALAKHDSLYMIAILSMMTDDATIGVVSGKIALDNYSDITSEWITFFDYAKIEFEGDDHFERYFQEQKREHYALFDAFSL
ncbi:hypothetical protein ACR3IL_08645 [Streptococcus iniae]|nr:hypothetical protein [Streptococcus iniae]OHX26188.1 hypothetical protein BKX95_11825 [Streptococcus iniae]